MSRREQLCRRSRPGERRCRGEALIRLTARTMPLRQWEVARAVRERLKIALDTADDRSHIHIAGAAVS